MVLNVIGAQSFRTGSPAPVKSACRFWLAASAAPMADGELPNLHVPIIPGHEIAGRIDVIGEGVTGLAIGERVGHFLVGLHLRRLLLLLQRPGKPWRWAAI